MVIICVMGNMTMLTSSIFERQLFQKDDIRMIDTRKFEGHLDLIYDESNNLIYSEASYWELGQRDGCGRKVSCILNTSQSPVLSLP